MKALVIILAYNEEESIQRVIQEARRALDSELLVIDDGSTDETRERALEAGARCISLAVNAGIGVAEQVGFQVAEAEGHDCVIRIDGDGQHDPEDLPMILEALREDHADLVIGSRYLGKGDSENGNIRRFGTKFLSWLVSRFTDYRITDATCGFRGYNRRAVEVFAEDYPDDFPEVEALMISNRKGLEIKEVPVNSLCRECGESVIKPGIAIYYMSKVTLAVIVNWLRGKGGSGA